MPHAPIEVTLSWSFILRYITLTAQNPYTLKQEYILICTGFGIHPLSPATRNQVGPSIFPVSRYQCQNPTGRPQATRYLILHSDQPFYLANTEFLFWANGQVRKLWREAFPTFIVLSITPQWRPLNILVFYI